MLRFPMSKRPGLQTRPLRDPVSQHPAVIASALHSPGVPHAIATLLCSKWLHPCVVEASGNRKEIAGRIHVIPIEQCYGEVRSLGRFAQTPHRDGIQDRLVDFFSLSAEL